ncbi:MAG: MGH1-like glycoside hydrolase domain-containing protein [Eubacteriales bacterium]
MTYKKLKKMTNTGWNTWNTSNVLSHVHLPHGFAINICIREFKTGEMLRESLIGRFGEHQEKITPGPRTYDGKYTELNLKFCDLELEVRTTVIGDEQIILLNPLKRGCRTPVAVIEACLLWGKNGSLSQKGSKIKGKFKDRTFKIYTTGNIANLQHTYSLSPYIAVELDGPVVVSTVKCTLEEAEMHLDAAKAELEAENSSFGKHSEAYTAMKTCLAWDTIYEAEHDRVCSTVSRLWNIGWGGYVLFDWDTYFAALMASPDNKELAYLNAIAITDEVTESGFIPNFGSAFDNKSRDRSQPPVGSFVCLEIYKKWQEKWFLRHVFDALVRWNLWFYEHRTTEEGYLCWGSDPYTPKSDRYWEINHINCSEGGALESGLDNSPMYDNIPFDSEHHMMMLGDVGLMGLYICDCRSLCEIAEIIGETNVVLEIIARKEKVEAALQTMWSDEKGMFLNKNLATGELSERISPTNFYAFQADNITEEQKSRMTEEHFYNAEEFWGDYIMPTIARNDPAFPDQNYWRGRIWAPTNYLAYIAVKHQNLDKVCDDLADKSEELLLKEWREHGHVHENYSGIDGWGCGVGNSDKFYHWGGLLAYIAIDNENRKK